MTSDPQPNEASDRAAARKRIQARRQFKLTAMTFAAVWVLLIVIWAATGADDSYWPVYPIGGMAIALFFQGMALRTDNPISEDEIDRELARR